jgi:hypothetical protein
MEFHPKNGKSNIHSYPLVNIQKSMKKRHLMVFNGIFVMINGGFHGGIASGFHHVSDGQSYKPRIKKP